MTFQRPWDEKHSHEEDMLEADLRIDAWTLRTLRALGDATVVIADSVISLHRKIDGITKSQVVLAKGQRKIMGLLDPITAAIAADRAATQAEHDEVAQALVDLQAKADALQATIDGMTAGAVSQAEIDAAAADAASLATDIGNIYTAPVVEPPVV